MERWKAVRIAEIIGHHRGSSYGLAIRLQQQFGMSWGEATALAGYDDSPRATYTPKPEPPGSPVVTPEEIERYNEEILRKKALAQKEKEDRQIEKEELLNRHRERLKKDPIERINELMELAEARGLLSVIRDYLWHGIGVVDKEPTIIHDKKTGAHIGVLMLRAPYINRLENTVTHKIITEWTWSDAADPSKWEEVVDSRTVKDYEDFASVRVGIYLPHLDPEPSYLPDRDQEKIAVQILQSNLELSGTLLRDERVLHTYVPIDSWPDGVLTGYWPRNHRIRHRSISEEDMLAKTLNDLLGDEIKDKPLNIRDLRNPLPPLRDDQPWYKRLFS